MWQSADRQEGCLRKLVLLHGQASYTLCPAALLHYESPFYL